MFIERSSLVRMERVSVGMLWIFTIFLFAQTSLSNGDLFGEPGLECNQDSMQYTISKVQIGDAAPKLAVLDKEGAMQTFSEDPSCGTSLTEKSDGSIVILSMYDGCYIHQQNGTQTMVMDIYSKDDYGTWKNPERLELRCPVGPVMDAPSPSQCSAIQLSERVACGGSPISQALCQDKGCCYDYSDTNNPCYYGNKATVHCTQDGMFSIAISKYLTLPALSLSTLRITRGSGPSCSPTAQTDAFLIFSFPLSSCGTTFKSIDGNIVYENELMSQRAVQTWRGSSITRDSTFKLTVRCSLSSDSLIPVQVNVLTRPPPSGISSSGPLNLELRIAKDLQYTQYYNDLDYPVVKILREPVFVEVRIIQRVDPQLVLVLQQCWATPLSSPYHQKQWPLLIDGCPFTGDNYLTAPIDSASSGLDFPSHYKRFVVNTFTFVDSASQQPLALDGQVFFHCSASVCIPSDRQNCEVSCSRQKRSANKEHITLEENLVSSPGPINFKSILKEGSLSRGSRLTLQPLKLEWVGIAVVLGITCLAVSAVGFLKCRKNTGTINVNN